MKEEFIKLAKKENLSIEIFEKKNDKVDINTMNGTVSLFQISNITTYIIKAIKGENSVQLVTDHLDHPSEIIDNIKTIFTLQDNENKNHLCKGKIRHKLTEKEHLDYKKVKEDFLSLADLKKEFPEIATIETTYSHYENGYYIDNEACQLEDETYYNEYGTTITTEKNGKRKATYFNYYTRDYDFLKFKNLLLTKLKTVILKLDDDTCKSQKYNIILKNTAVALLLKELAPSFQSKEIAQKTSILSGMQKKPIFGDKITIIEDPRAGIESHYFDTEGTETYQKEIVKNGIFAMEINNLEYAIKMKTAPTGNAYGVNNLYIKPGNLSEEELLLKLDHGFIIDEIYGLHSGIDRKTGAISLQAEGLFVEHGKIIKGLEMIVLSTNFFELFTNVIEVGKECSHNLLDISAPSLLLKNIMIVGKK